MRRRLGGIFILTLLSMGAEAQLRLPALPLPAVPLQAIPQTLNQAESRSLERLTDLRHVEIDRLIRANRRVVEADPDGDPIVRGEILDLAVDDDAIARARALGFLVDRQLRLGTSELGLTVLRSPANLPTTQALRKLRELDPAGLYDYNHIYSGGGAVSDEPTAAPSPSVAPPSVAPPSPSPLPLLAPPAPVRARIRVGLLDGGIDASHPSFQGSDIRRWGCGGKPAPSVHGTAVASLLVAHVSAELYAADVYCGLPTGGAVDAIVAAFGWLMQEQVAVINVSLVGPKNTLLERIVSVLTARGYVIVAAVGNDGPTAPPLYPAAYAHVVGVTGVDSQRRVLLEALRGPQVMFAALGADLKAANIDHGFTAVRGTSFAAPSVAALLAQRLTDPDKRAADAAVDSLASQAIDLGAPGRDLTYGFGLVGGATP
jgi:hypothetical protein